MFVNADRGPFQHAVGSLNRGIQLIRDHDDQRKYRQSRDLQIARNEEERQRAQTEDARPKLDPPVHEGHEHPSEQNDAREEYEDHLRPAASISRIARRRFVISCRRSLINAL